MAISHIEIHDFRNIGELRAELSPGFNVFVGANGAGKTAVLEAVFMLGRGRSFRTTRTKQVIRRDQSALLVRGTVLSGGLESLLAIRRTHTGEATLRVNGQSESKLSALAERLPLQVLLPNASDVVFGGPGERRHLLDWGLFHVKHGYHQALRTLHRLLKQRNAWLRAVAEQPGSPDVWTEPFIDAAMAVHEMRSGYVEALADSLASYVSGFSLPGAFELTYQSGWSGDSRDELHKKLSDGLPREVKLGSTQVGPHRADLRFHVDGESAAATLSRGQAKSLAIALTLAQAEHLQRVSDQLSVFLVDDLGAELDRSAARELFRILDSLGCQVLATAVTTPDGLLEFMQDSPRELRVFHVKHGALETS